MGARSKNTRRSMPITHDESADAQASALAHSIAGEHVHVRFAGGKDDVADA